MRRGSETHSLDHIPSPFQSTISRTEIFYLSRFSISHFQPPPPPMLVALKWYILYRFFLPKWYYVNIWFYCILSLGTWKVDKLEIVQYPSWSVSVYRNLFLPCSGWILLAFQEDSDIQTPEWHKLPRLGVTELLVRLFLSKVGFKVFTCDYFKASQHTSQASHWYGQSYVETDRQPHTGGA